MSADESKRTAEFTPRSDPEPADHLPTASAVVDGAPGTASFPPLDAGAATGSHPNPGTFAQTPSLAEQAARLSDSGEVRESVRSLPEIPGYELLEEVGAGGMGVVYRACEIALDRDVAVKILRERYPVNSPAARRFVDEARITAQLQHPAIPPVHHIGTFPDGRPFLVMKLIKGETLADLLTTEPAHWQFVAVFAQVCQAVAYAHSRKVIHRDLKPANVMVGSFGEVQLMDWGLAKVLTDQLEQPEATEDEDERTEIRTQREADAHTQVGSVLGTPSFMSPEQAQGAVNEIDERSDVFGLGAMLCAILTGAPPYSASDSDSVRLMAIRGETGNAFARLDESGADLVLVALCKWCLTQARQLRPRDAGMVAKVVAAHLAEAKEQVRQAELDRVRSEEQQKRERERSEANQNLARARVEEQQKRERERSEADQNLACARAEAQRNLRRVRLKLYVSMLLLLALTVIGGLVLQRRPDCSSTRSEDRVQDERGWRDSSA